MITQQDLVAGIRFAGQRAAAAGQSTRDWEFQLGHEWTSGDAFRHLAGVAGQLPSLYPLFSQGALAALSPAEIDQLNAQGVADWTAKSREAVLEAIVAGHEASAAFVATLDQEGLATVVRLGGYELPQADLVAQIWIHHAIAHAYEASARWPLR